MSTKCISIALDYASDNVLDKKIIFNELRDLRHKTFLACNRAMTYFYTNDMQNFIQKDIGLPEQKDKDVYGKTFGAWVENRMNEIMEGALSNNVAATRQFVSNRYSGDKKKGLLKGQVSLSEFKLEMPIFIHNKAFTIIDTPKGLGVEISLFNLKKQKELGVKKIKFLFPGINSGEKAVLVNIMLNAYKQGTGQISYNSRKKKWMFTISYSFENTVKELNDNLYMGIDLGITNVATMSIFNAEKEEYSWFRYKDRIIDGLELIHLRQKIFARRRSLCIASKYAADSKIGHGYKARTAAANKIGDKYSRFRDTYNHKISRYIVDTALKYGVKHIQMENLTGFSEKQEESLLRNWSYYDLQNKIKYKAEEHGIEVILVDSKYTSKRCSVCGNIDDANRDCKNDQANFTCTCCGHHENADINASKNIAVPNIDIIIKEYIEAKKQAASTK